MLDWLQTILGEHYTEELDKTIAAEIGKRFVSKADFGTKSDTVKELKEQLAAANAQIESFKDMDIDGIKASAAEWKQKAEEAEQAAEARVKELTHDNLLREKLSGLKFTSDYAKQGVFNEIKAKNLPVDGDRLTGFDEVLDAIRKAQPSAFEPETAAPQFTRGITPPGTESGMQFHFTGVREKSKN